MVLAISIVSLAILIPTSFAILLYKYNKLHRELCKIKLRNPTELDLELATFGQILNEIKRRPVRYLMIFPQFVVNEDSNSVAIANMAIEGSGMPEEVATDVVKAAAYMMEHNMGSFKPEEE
jgi:hypothetical protein